MKRLHLFFGATSMLLVLYITLFNSYIANLKGAEIDAERFLLHANDWAATGELKVVVDAEFFIQYLGILIRYFSLDEFGLTFVGVIVFYIAIMSVFIMYKNVRMQNSYLFYTLILLCLFSPSVLLRMGALLREPYVIFSILFGVIFAVKYIECKKGIYALCSVALILVGAFFHKALLAFLPIYLILFMGFSVEFEFKKILIALMLLFIFIVGVSLLLPNLMGLRGGAALSVIISGDIDVAEKIVGYKSDRDFRTTYDYGADFSSIPGVILTAIKANVYYYFAPFPWNVRASIDVVAFIENTLRATIILYLLMDAIKSKCKSLLFVLTCYFLINTIWAVGTSNYGTGSRHHITTIPLLLLAYMIVQSKSITYNSFRGKLIRQN